MCFVGVIPKSPSCPAAPGGLPGTLPGRAAGLPGARGGRRPRRAARRGRRAARAAARVRRAPPGPLAWTHAAARAVGHRASARPQPPRPCATRGGAPTLQLLEQG